MLHNDRYDFNDDVLSIGASYWARLVERNCQNKTGASHPNICELR